MYMSKAVASELDAFIVDNEDGELDDSLHRAAWRGDEEELELLLTRSTDNIDLRLRPFYATPLRLAAMNKHHQCVAVLTQYGCAVDLEDNKGQTALLCAMRNRDTQSCYILLQAGASPEGSPRNLTTPLYSACQDGYAAGVKMLLSFGAEMEYADAGGMPWKQPLHVTVAYHHLSCFILLLEAGADVSRAGHILHTICTKMCVEAFVRIWAAFGGNLWHRNEKGLLAVDIPENKHTALLQELMSTPMSLRSLCRLKIRKQLGRSRLSNIEAFPIPRVLTDLLRYRDFPEVSQLTKELEEARKTNS